MSRFFGVSEQEFLGKIVHFIHNIHKIARRKVTINMRCSYMYMIYINLVYVYIIYLHIHRIYTLDFGTSCFTLSIVNLPFLGDMSIKISQRISFKDFQEGESRGHSLAGDWYEIGDGTGDEEGTGIIRNYFSAD